MYYRYDNFYVQQLKFSFRRIMKEKMKQFIAFVKMKNKNNEFYF